MGVISRTYERRSDEGNVERRVLVFTQALDPGQLGKCSDTREDRVRSDCYRDVSIVRER